jgi:hypothetical protein
MGAKTTDTVTGTLSLASELIRFIATSLHPKLSTKSMRLRGAVVTQNLALCHQLRQAPQLNEIQLYVFVDEKCDWGIGSPLEGYSSIVSVIPVVQL